MAMMTPMTNLIPPSLPSWEFTLTEKVILSAPITLKILSCLSVKDLGSCALVSKHWNSITSQNDIWEGIASRMHFPIHEGDVIKEELAKITRCYFNIFKFIQPYLYFNKTKYEKLCDKEKSLETKWKNSRKPKRKAFYQKEMEKHEEKRQIYLAYFMLVQDCFKGGVWLKHLHHSSSFPDMQALSKFVFNYLPPAIVENCQKELKTFKDPSLLSHYSTYSVSSWFFSTLAIFFYYLDKKKNDKATKLLNCFRFSFNQEAFYYALFQEAKDRKLFMPLMDVVCKLPEEGCASFYKILFKYRETFINPSTAKELLTRYQHDFEVNKFLTYVVQIPAWLALGEHLKVLNFLLELPYKHGFHEICHNLLNQYYTEHKLNKIAEYVKKVVNQKLDGVECDAIEVLQNIDVLLY